MRRISAPPDSSANRAHPHHLFDEDLEAEFLCCLLWAAQKAADAGDERALRLWSIGVSLEPEDFFRQPHRRIYEGIRAVVARQEFPTTGMVKNELVTKYGYSDEMTAYWKLVLKGTRIGAIPALLEKVGQLAAARREWDRAHRTIDRMASGQ